MSVLINLKASGAINFKSPISHKFSSNFIIANEFTVEDLQFQTIQFHGPLQILAGEWKLLRIHNFLSNEILLKLYVH